MRRSTLWVWALVALGGVAALLVASLWSPRWTGGQTPFEGPGSPRGIASEARSNASVPATATPASAPGEHDGEKGDLAAAGRSLVVRVVHSRSGEPLADARIELLATARAPRVTGREGVVRFDGLPAKHLRVVATWPAAAAQSWAHADVELSRSSPETSHELRLEASTGSIVGIVRDQEGQPVSGATVSLVRPRPPYPSSSAYRASPYTRVRTGGDGRYELRPVRASRLHSLAAGAPGYSVQRQRQIAVIDGELTTVDFTLSPNRRLRGHIELPAGPRRAWVRVVAAIVTDPTWVPGQPVHEATSFYVLHPADVLPSGAFELQVPDDATGVVLLATAEGLTPVGTDVDVRSLSTTDREDSPDVRLRLDAPGAVLAGTVTDQAGVGVASEVEFADPVTQFVHAIARTDDDGNFRCGSLRHGRYTCAVRETGVDRPRTATISDVLTGQTDLRFVVRADE